MANNSPSAAQDVPLNKKPLKLISMKLSPAQPGDYEIPEAIANEPMFPWGLCLTLNNDSLKKLGIPLPDVSNTFTLVAQVVVVRTSANKAADGDNCLSADLQITEMRLIDPNYAADQAQKIWPD